MAGDRSMWLWAILTIILNKIFVVGCERILLMAPIYPADVRTFLNLGTLLTERGHHVTIVVPNMAVIDEEKRSQLHVLTFMSVTVQSTLDEDWIKGAVRAVSEGSRFETLAYLYDSYTRMTSACIDLLEDETLYRTLEKRKFDFALTGMVACSAYLPYKFGIPYAQIDVLYQLPAWPSYYMFPKLEGTPFLDILCGTAYGTFTDVLHWIFYGTNDNHSIHEFANEIFHPYAIFIFRNEMTDYPSMNPRHVIYTGNLQKMIPKQLPQAINEFVEGATHGVILIAFGSWLESSDLLQVFLLAFRELPYRILIKSRSKPVIPAPENFLILPWLPITDLLAHHKTRIIIYHGGLNTMNEATYHGVPSIIIPFIFDHHYNAAISESKGYGKVLQVQDLSVKMLQKTVNLVINEEETSERARSVSQFIKQKSMYGIDIIENQIKIFIKYGDIYSQDNVTSYTVHVDLYMLTIYVILYLFMLVFFMCIAAALVCTRHVRNRKNKSD